MKDIDKEHAMHQIDSRLYINELYIIYRLFELVLMKQLLITHFIISLNQKILIPLIAHRMLVLSCLHTLWWILQPKFDQTYFQYHLDIPFCRHDVYGKVYYCCYLYLHSVDLIPCFSMGWGCWITVKNTKM